MDEHPSIVNAPPWAQRAIDALEAHGVEVEIVGQPTGTFRDLVLRLTAHGETRTYTAELKSSLTAASLSLLASRTTSPPLIITPHVGRSLGEDCRRLGIAYADGAGNMFLEWDRVLIDVEGRKPVWPTRGRSLERPLRAFRPSGAQVVFCLLSFPGLLDQPYRDIASASGVSLGTVQRVMAELVDLDHVEVERNGRRLHRVRALFDRWLEAYALNLYPSLLLGRYEGEEVQKHLDLETPVEEFDAQWGGEAAVALQDRYLRPASLTLYAAARPTKLLSRLRVRKVEEGGNVMVRRRFWDHSFLPGPVVPSTLIYADLVASTDSRQIEAAARLRETDALLRSLDER